VVKAASAAPLSRVGTDPHFFLWRNIRPLSKVSSLREQTQGDHPHRVKALAYSGPVDVWLVLGSRRGPSLAQGRSPLKASGQEEERGGE
jgi:hypothetical protein